MQRVQPQLRLRLFQKDADPIVVGAILAATALWGLYVLRRLGGVTGDLLGAAAVVAELVALVAFATWW